MKRTKRQRSPMVHDFSRIPSANIPRSSFNLSQAYKTTFDASKLIPFFLQEVVPGDTHSVTCHALARLATPLKPFMDNVAIETFFFFCPNRLVWPNFLKMMGEQDNPGDSTDFVIPTFSDGTVTEGSTADYFGLPLGASLVGVSALPFRMMHLTWNQWFRAQDLQDSLPVNTNDGPETFATYENLMIRGKRHDYFSSALPFPQFGPGVDLPLGETAPIFAASSGALLGIRSGDGDGSLQAMSTDGGTGLDKLFMDLATAGQNEMFADLSGASAATINDLRQAFQIQKLQERDARGGHRYQELVLSHFGVRGGDARLNRVEYLGGNTMQLGIVQVPQTSDQISGGPGAETPQGNLAAYGISQGKSGFTKSFTEHGYILGFVNARADLTYQKGIDRHWNRSTKYDFYWPALAKLGEQAILNKELFVQNNAQDDEVWGYQERWAEMRHNNSKITGLFRSDATASLDVWHLSQDFAALPNLNDEFIRDDAPLDRVIAVPDEPHFLLDAYFQHRAARPMPINGAPGYIDHF